MIDAREPSSNIGRKFVGITTFKVVNINPDVEALKKMLPEKSLENFKGYTAENEKLGKTAYIDIWISKEVDKVLAKLRFFINEKPKFDKSLTKNIWVDKNGVSTIWSTPEEMKSRNYQTENFKKTQKYNWFDVKSARPSHGDEDQLYAFLRGWLGLGRKEKNDGTVIPARECILDVNNLLNGDFSQIKGLQSQKEAIVPLGVEKWVDESVNPSVTKWQYKAYTKAFSGGFGRSLCSAYVTGTPEEQEASLNARYMKMAEIIKKNTEQGYNDTYFGDFPYFWSEFDTNAGSVVVKPGNGVSDNLPF